MSSILVLGGAGYIGSHTVYELIEAGENVVVVDNLETGFRKAVHPDAKFYQGDIRDRAFIDSVFEKEDIDGVIHFAANSQVGESMVNPLKYYNNNLCGTEVLLESMVAHGINKIVFSSTAATYGEPERIPILETDRTVPTNCYGETKLSMEMMFKWTANAHDLRFVSLRYFNACGAHPNGKIGEGDGIVVAAMGMLIGWYEILLLFSQACFLSAGYGLWLMVVRKSGKNRAFPFIPFLFMAVLFFSFFGR